MKAPDFWYRPSSSSALFFFPLGQLYRAVGFVRRVVTKPYRSPVPVICVGNIVAGGAGKTPTALALAHLLKQQKASPVFVSRGYGGHEKGPLRVDPHRHTVRDVGDEALLLSRIAPCWIGRYRAAAVRAAETHATHIILDDGLQNPTVAPTISLLVIDGGLGLGNGHLIPGGPLRETLDDALHRVAAVVMIGEDRQVLLPCLTKPVLRAQLQCRLPDDFPRDQNFFAFSGIAHPEKFYATCRKAGLALKETRDFPDHHVFDEKELSAFGEIATTRNLQLITTAKDWVRLPESFRRRVRVVPVELVFEDPAAVMRILQSSMAAARAPS